MPTQCGNLNITKPDLIELYLAEQLKLSTKHDILCVTLSVSSIVAEEFWGILLFQRSVH